MVEIVKTCGACIHFRPDSTPDKVQELRDKSVNEAWANEKSQDPSVQFRSVMQLFFAQQIDSGYGRRGCEKVMTSCFAIVSCIHPNRFEAKTDQEV